MSQRYRPFVSAPGVEVQIDTYGEIYGLPAFGDDVIVADVRDMPDPADHAAFDNRTGYDPDVRSYVQHSPGALTRVKTLMDAIQARLDEGMSAQVAIISRAGSRRCVVIGDIVHRMLDSRAPAVLRHQHILPAAAGLPGSDWTTPEAAI